MAFICSSLTVNNSGNVLTADVIPYSGKDDFGAIKRTFNKCSYSGNTGADPSALEHQCRLQN